ncbi:hypothetical protein HYZ70_02220 [Candidatus Curtissbacteria bacterium]|nr:hypothetical protein [Candidatus Curtissbacteria bacterium]
MNGERDHLNERNLEDFFSQQRAARLRRGGASCLVQLGDFRLDEDLIAAAGAKGFYVGRASLRRNAETIFFMPKSGDGCLMVIGENVGGTFNFYVFDNDLPRFKERLGWR